MKVALCLIVKFENIYLKEYIEYYKNVIEIDHIYLYDNNKIDGELAENVHEVTQEYEDDNFITVIDVRGREHCQIDSYNECYHKYGNQYDWICFFDVDEFLYLPNTFKNIKEYLSQNVFNNFYVIAIPWVMYGDSEYLFYEDKPVQERFVIPSGRIDIFYDNAWLKSIVRTNIENFNWEASVPQSSPHIPNYLFGLNDTLPLRICGVYGQPVRAGITDPGNICRNIHSEVHLKHYWSKSAEEYMIKKIKYVEGNDRKFVVDDEIDQYFKKNTFSMVKLKVLINTFNVYKEKFNLPNDKIII